MPGNNIWTTLLMLGGLLVITYFLMIRPAQRKMKAQQEMVASLGEGSRVMLTSGVYCTIKHLGDKQAVVEVSPGMDLTVARGAIARAVQADEDEFEYADEAEPAGYAVEPGSTHLAHEDVADADGTLAHDAALTPPGATSANQPTTTPTTAVSQPTTTPTTATEPIATERGRD